MCQGTLLRHNLRVLRTARISINNEQQRHGDPVHHGKHNDDEHNIDPDSHTDQQQHHQYIRDPHTFQ
eukprot:CAMPEP_0115474814 /NCGR_PEP_ID=MMETSP0271-20121206/54293_1 /TAXON_ID=71861 /ORGANISM="Scrippsiella trochoidea, Strain CCMP3099" /LENGTH=66 /DNA_ID=CAMNT_0002902163 /DNA_START=64 /DNA_END=261 /DNA_ORIENTATION=+